MNSRVPYTYSILRYVHDVATGEFVNVGVVIHSHQANFFQAKCRTTFARVSEFFPDLDTKAFKALMKSMNSRLRELSNAHKDSLCIPPNGQALPALLSSILPDDDSALRWTPPVGGISGDLDALSSRLFERYVSKYDNHNAMARRTDADVWRHFSKELDRRHIGGYFVEKTVEGSDDRVKFKSAWKNGVWHCIEPLSFDLSAPDSIKEKARLFLGQMTSVADTREQIKLYVLLGKPSNPSLCDAYQHALQIIKKISFPQEIYTEDQAEILALNLESQIASHNEQVEKARLNH